MARKKRTSLHRWLFPGIVFHEFSHYLACLLFGVRIKSVKWFGEDEAYVLHAVPKPVPSLFIALAPFLLGNALAFLLLETAQSQLAAFNPLALLFYWFAVSLAFYSFPSDQDGQNAFENVLKSYRTLFSGPTPLPFKLLAGDVLGVKPLLLRFRDQLRAHQRLGVAGA